MEEVKRWQISAEYPDKVEAHVEGPLVLYTDYAALKARVEAVDRMHDLVTEAYERTLKERDTLRAQLEAAELAARFNGERVSMLEATVTSLTKPQLTAQPDGVGEAAMAELLAKQNSKIAKAHAALEALCGEDPQSEFDEGYCPHCGVRVGNSLPCHDKDHAKGCAFIKGRKALKALAAPAPAPRQVTHVCPACQPHTCEKAPAPACKACGGKGRIWYPGTGHPETTKPCPDCAHEEGG